MHIKDSESFGQMAKRLRLAAGLSNRAAARKIGVADGTLIRIENGATPLLSTAIRLLQFYGASATIGVEGKKEETS